MQKCILKYIFHLLKSIVDLTETRNNFLWFEEFFTAVHGWQHASLLLALSLIQPKWRRIQLDHSSWSIFFFEPTEAFPTPLLQTMLLLSLIQITPCTYFQVYISYFLFQLKVIKTCWENKDKQIHGMLVSKLYEVCIYFLLLNSW